ncbi:MAG TPA: asparagine synthase (glutamine-hydrolyzing) [Thermoanaerobaculia bacterium]
MCGIAGAFLRREASRDALREAATAMSSCLRHRGPDDAGEWIDDANGLMLAFRRLSIIDVSPAGHQPMVSASGRYVLVFNGEVYNFAAIRAELEGTGAAPDWRGHSDTEVMLAAIERWGLDDALGRFIGMFAIALWDRTDRVLHLIRDRMGVKPLYYGFIGDAVLFASELKSVVAHPLFRGEIDRDVVSLYTRFGYVPTPHAIYRGFRKLSPGCIVSISPGSGRAEPRPWWDLESVVVAGVNDRFTGSEDEAVDMVDRVVCDAVRLRMVSDVPLGVFLSGGIDSSLVAAVMQKQSSTPVRTFSIGFRENVYDEAPHAAAVARHLGTEHTELYVSAQEALDVIPMLPAMYDEPFADSSQIPTYLVSKLARQSVTVSLSGDGGDELFGGYSRYVLGRKLWQRTEALPRPLRLAAGRLLRALPVGGWNRLLSPESSVLPARLRRQRAGEQIHKLSRAMESRSADALYRGMVTFFDELVPDVRPLPVVVMDDRNQRFLEDFTERMMYFDQVSYLMDDILVKVDRASMAVSLEAREPLLDHRLVELAWRLPLHFKLRNGKGKWILREVLARHVPRHLFERPKMGFALPLDAWLRGPLRDWAETLLEPRRLLAEGYFDVRQVRALWSDHLNGRGEWQHHIWIVLMFQAWLDENR